VSVERNSETEVAAAPPPSSTASARDDEQSVVAQARDGSSSAVEELVRRYEHKLFRLVQKITLNHEDAEEVVQNAFLRAFQNLDSFRGDSRFYTWLVRIAVNEALMKIRGHRIRQVSIDGAKETEDDLGPRELKDGAPNPEELYSQEELRSILATTIDELDPGYRMVLQLRDIEGLSTNDTARALGLSSTAVKSRLSRARLRLQNSLALYFQAPHRRHKGALALGV
jgi:RNA polymerase sigma-70 factor, ECF subfamily